MSAERCEIKFQCGDDSITAPGTWDRVNGKPVIAPEWERKVLRFLREHPGQEVITDARLVTGAR